MHSSPIEAYESVNCFGKYVENMTAAECEQCQMEITNYTFISVPTLLDWAEDKVNVFVSMQLFAIFIALIEAIFSNL